MNLKEFCELNNLKYDTVKSWKGRGKLKENLDKLGLVFEETPTPIETEKGPTSKKVEAPLAQKNPKLIPRDVPINFGYFENFTVSKFPIGSCLYCGTFLEEDFSFCGKCRVNEKDLDVIGIREQEVTLAEIADLIENPEFYGYKDYNEVEGVLLGALGKYFDHDEL